MQWWYEFIPQFQGTGIMWLLDVQEFDQEFAVDASLNVAGGVLGNDYFRVKFPSSLNDKCKITHYELWAVIVAVKLWGERFRGKVIPVRSDNEAVATIINTGCSKDSYLQAQLCELLWWTAKMDFKLKSVHLSGHLNRLPDMSRGVFERSNIKKSNLLLVKYNIY